MPVGTWQFWIDRGGTFTDVIAVSPDGSSRVLKLLSSDRAAIDGIHAAIARWPGPDLPFPPCIVRMGTTVATNALLERKGEPTVFVVTKGFRDLLLIGYQNRPRLFDLDIRKPESLPERVIEVDERVTAEGTVLRAPDPEAVERELAAARRDGFRSIAVVLMHSYAFPEHERLVGDVAGRLGFEQISLSSDVIPTIKIVGRGDTTVADAYLTPGLRRYVNGVRAALPAEAHLQLMQSNGGLADAQRFSGKDAILSGPAGGAVACARIAQQAGYAKAIGFDMGGTSTGVSRFEDRHEYTYETEVAGVRLKAPMMRIETVAAGGGSILHFDGRKFAVGPDSAGADPGPACYGRGGPLTVTDANLYLGRISSAHFPFPLDEEVVRRKFEELQAEVRAGLDREMSTIEIAEGFLRIANENMANAIKKISVARGYDVRDHALVAFGGAGAQHACALARLLDIKTIIVPPHAGVLSALGIGLADVTRSYQESVLRPLSDTTLREIVPRFEASEERGRRELASEGIDEAQIHTRRSLALRYQGVDHALMVPEPADLDYRSAFEELHRRQFGFLHYGRDLEVAELMVEAVGQTASPFPTAGAPQPGPDGAELGDVPVHLRSRLQPGHSVAGPAVVVDETATIVVDPGFCAEIDGHRNVVIQAGDGETTPVQTPDVATDCDPVMLEVFNNLFTSVADQMGYTLQRVALSTNVKERLDFSCAVFDAGGDLVANAHHIPVHLGAMGETVQAILDQHGDTMQPGDAFVSNNPYRGGSHLPDVTVVSPVYDARGNRIFFTASRAHHADIGGVAPGSMPAFSKSIGEEGVLLDGLKLVSAGELREDEIRRIMLEGHHPVRGVDERLADLQAQIAANTTGAQLLLSLVESYSRPVVSAYMGHVQRNAEECVRELLSSYPDGDHEFRDQLDDGTPICVKIVVRQDEATADFTGTGPQVTGNLNAPRAVVTAAVLYVFRALLKKDIPLNAGCLRPITIRIPEGTVLSPRSPAAVAGGNVETSQRICDVLLAALGAAAASQGTMNNLSFGDGTSAYYETIAGGAGAGPGFHGAHAVHTHMTNTRITDPEVLEVRHPVLLREFSIRRGSGGKGDYRGGDGIVRRIEFRKPLHVTVLSERRSVEPFGLNGADSGDGGRNILTRANGSERQLPGKADFDVRTGDVLSIHTPGGGGCNVKRKA